MCSIRHPAFSKKKDATYVPFLGLGSTTCLEDKEEEDTEAARLLEEPGSRNGIKIEKKMKEVKMILSV